MIPLSTFGRERSEPGGGARESVLSQHLILNYASGALRPGVIRVRGSFIGSAKPFRSRRVLRRGPFVTPARVEMSTFVPFR